MSNLLIHFVVAGSMAAIITIVIRILHDLHDMKSPSEVLKQELTVENDDVKLTIETEGKIKPSEVLDMIEGVDKGILTVNEARKISDLRPVKGDPFVEFQTNAQRFGVHINKQNGEESVGGSTIRRASNCPNCGANLTQNGVCAYCGTTYN